MKINSVEELENFLDKKVSSLSIWKKSFQSIYSVILLTAENIDFKGNTDTAADYLSRISLIYPIIKKNASEKNSVSTSESLLKTGIIEYHEDINFLNAYAHFSMLMPQIHRGTFKIEEIKENKLKINYSNTLIKESELIDKIYSRISIPIYFTFKEEKKVIENTSLKAKKREYNLCYKDFMLIREIYEQHINYSINVEVIPDELVVQKLGFSYSDFRKFIAVLRSFSEYFIFLSRSYKDEVNNKNSSEDNDKLMAEYMEWSVCCLSYKTKEWFISISGIEEERFNIILSYFIDIYSDKTGEKFYSNSFIGDGFLTPITLMDKSIIYSPHALRHLLSFNNVLYSINRNNRELFDNEISSRLEPTYINQIQHLFSYFKNIKSVSNINYPEGEVDILFLSKEEKVCLSIQVKTTIAPDSSRTVARVQGRTYEAFEQIKKFEKLSKTEKLNLVNDAFNCELDEVKIINLIVVRSSAGSDKAWSINKKYRLLNYSILAKILCNKLKSKNYAFLNFDDEVKEEQEKIIKSSNWKVEYQSLKIDNFEIEFPDITINQKELLPGFIKSINCYSNFEKA